MAIWVCLVASWLFAGRAAAAESPVDWPLIDFAQITTNLFNKPTSITHAGDGTQRLFVTEQAGLTWVIQDDKVQARPFLDIRDRVLSTGAEQGLLSLAFPPGFPNTGHFYVYYTRRNDRTLTLSRFGLVAESGLADPTSERVVLAIPTTDIIHNGGQLAFGPDGYLYVGVGDGGPELDPKGNAQNPAKLLGKLLRIEVEHGAETYSVPPNNPFVGNNGYLPEIWAIGLRNPWRFSFDRLTGDLFIGDVGQNRFEEIDFQAAGSAGGQNYGWRLMEGTNKFNVPATFTNFPALTGPVVAYDHIGLPTDAAGSVTGGYVYRGPAASRMDGVYFYGDFMAGIIWGLKRDGANWLAQAVHRSASYGAKKFISTFGEGEDGRLYLADYFAGRIYEVRDTSKAWAPAFLPSPGIIASNHVMVTCATANAVIHFTTDGRDPTEMDPVVAAGAFIEVAAGVTNKLRAYRSDLSPSDVAVGVFSKVAAKPVFSPPGGPITNNTVVTIGSVTPGAALFYTTDGSMPTPNSTPYAGPMLVSAGTTLLALATADGFQNSLVSTAVFFPAVAAVPVFEPATGPVANRTVVSLSTATLGATIYYTVDGSPPTTNSPIYLGPFTIDGGTWVKAFASATGYLDSPEQATFFDLVRTGAPRFDPVPGPVPYGTRVSLNSATPGATIYYTIDGVAPTTNSAVYRDPLTINGPVEMAAFATAPEHLDSDAQRVSYTLTKAGMPVVSPPGGVFARGQVITLESPASNAVVRYTLDGSDPGTNSIIYDGPVILKSPLALKARAYWPQFSPSDIASKFFGMLEIERTVVTTFAGGTNAGLNNGVGALARFNRPYSIAADKVGGFYVTDSLNNRVRKLNSLGEVSPFAGTGELGHQLGPAAAAQFSHPTGVTVDRHGNVWVADCLRICKIDTDQEVTLFYEIGPCDGGIPPIWQIETDPNDNLYIGFAQTLVRISHDGKEAMVLANGDRFNLFAPVGLAIDPSGDIYQAVGAAVLVFRSSGAFERFAGLNAYFSDGPRLEAGFQWAQDVVLDVSGRIFVSDTSRIRSIHPDGSVTTLAGTGVTGYRNGRGGVAQFGSAAGLCVDGAGNIYVADSANNCIRKISPDTAGIGIADDWQMAHFGRVGIDPEDDPDHDGLSNYGEFWAGTNPLDPASVLAMERPALLPGGDVQIQWQTVAGKPYLVQFSSDLLTWNNLAGPVVGNGNTASMISSGQVGLIGQLFYRVILADL